MGKKSAAFWGRGLALATLMAGVLVTAGCENAATPKVTPPTDTKMPPGSPEPPKLTGSSQPGVAPGLDANGMPTGGR